MKAAYEQLVDGEIPCVIVGRDTLPEKAILLPGSFNPLHQGHEGLLRASESITGREGMFELSIVNVDKPPLSLTEVEQRLERMSKTHPAVLTKAPTFAEKAELFPGAWFALGYDTAIRLLSSAYHLDVPAMLSRFNELGTRFTVAGRLDDDGFKTLLDLSIPAGFEHLFIPIPPDLFREDISSTAIREQRL